MIPSAASGTKSLFGKPSFGRGEARGRSTDAAPGLWEQAFFYVSMIVLQGAFLATPRLIQGGGMIADDTGGDPINQASFGIVLLGTALLMGIRWRSSLSALRGNAFYFLLPLLIVASTVWSVDPALTLKRSVWTAGVCFFDLYIVTRLSLDDVLRIVSRTVLLSVLASIVVALALPTVGREVGEGLHGEWRGVFAQKNQLGHVMAVGAAVQLLVMLRAGRIRLGPSVMFLVCMILMALSESVTSMLATGVAALAVGAYACMRRGMMSALLGGLFAAAAACLVIGLLAQGDSGLGLLDRDSSLSGRTDLWPAVMEMIRMRPWFGWGFEAFWTPDNPYFDYVRTQAGWPAPNAHNGLLEITLETGIVGVTIFLLVMAWMVKRAAGLMAGGNLLGIMVLVVLVQLLIGNVSESFLLESTIFGWNFLSMLVLFTGAVPVAAAVPGRSAGSILERAKPREADVVLLRGR